MKRSDCGVPIDIVIFALQKEFDCVLETHGHLSSSYGTHKKQPSRSSNPAHLRAALAALRLIRTDVMVPQTSVIAKYEDAFEEYMRDAKNPHCGLEKKLADCPDTCDGKNSVRDFVLVHFPVASVPVRIRTNRSDGTTSAHVQYLLIRAGPVPVACVGPLFFPAGCTPPTLVAFFCGLPSRDHPPWSRFFVGSLPFYPRSWQKNVTQSHSTSKGRSP